MKEYKFGTQLSVSEDVHGYIILHDIMGNESLCKSKGMSKREAEAFEKAFFKIGEKE